MLEGKTIPVFGTLVILSMVILFIALLLPNLNNPILLLILLQDILVVPMLIVINFMGQGELNQTQLIGASAGGILIIFFLRAAMKNQLLRLPLNKDIHDDQDLQIFVGLFICFGLAWLTHLIGLSSALGAFVAGIIIGQDESTEKLKHNLNPFRVFFLALFFISIGLQLNTSFLANNIGVILLLVFL